MFFFPSLPISTKISLTSLLHGSYLHVLPSQWSSSFHFGRHRASPRTVTSFPILSGLFGHQGLSLLSFGLKMRNSLHMILLIGYHYPHSDPFSVYDTITSGSRPLLQVFVTNQQTKNHPTPLLSADSGPSHLGEVSDAIPERLHAIACQNSIRSSIKRGWNLLSGMNRKGRSINALIEV